MENPLNSCTCAKAIWSFIPLVFGWSNHNPKDVVETLGQWNQNLFSNPIINRAWTLVGRFTQWALWKEINERIFINRRRKLEKLWELIKQNIREIILTGDWSLEDFKTDIPKMEIMTKLDLAQKMLPLRKVKQQQVCSETPSRFTPSPPLLPCRLN